jgi:hypothetical protein
MAVLFSHSRAEAAAEPLFAYVREKPDGPRQMNSLNEE